jgi:hypothetical protein
MARKTYEPDEKTAAQVKRMSGLGITHDQIARIIGISDETLRKYYPDELENGATQANATVAQNLFRIATGNDKGAVAAAIFWMKTRARWRETNHTEISGPDGAAISVHQTTTLDASTLTPEQRDALRAVLLATKG